jgi:carboxyl-terminal processing protease
MLDETTGYVRVVDFGSDTGEVLHTQLEVLAKEGATQMVLDLRNAAFGDPADAVPVAERFMDGGLVATRVGRRVNETRLQADPARRAWDGPLVVLVDSGTSGPGEIVAAALAETAEVPLVGEHTFGRAAVSQPVPLSVGGLILTSAKYMSPGGISIHGSGLEPSVPVAAAHSDEGAVDEEEAEAPRPDPILERALEVLAERAETPSAEEEVAA